MTIQNFMEKYNIAVFVRIDKDGSMEIIRSETAKLESDVLFEQLITFRDISSIINTVDDRTPTMNFAQDTTRCVITKNSDFVIYVFYESELNVFEDYDFYMKISDELINIERYA
ncbi:MAG: hypothetical protein K2J40_09275 [Ruminococcus sp.]|nr:hypothetical protein [Ruminococcus sp.]